MADKQAFKQEERVQLASNTKYAGKVFQVIAPYVPDDQYYYQVNWDNGSVAMYAADALIKEPKTSFLDKVKKMVKGKAEKKS